MSKRNTVSLILIGALVAALTFSVGPAAARQPDDARSEHQKTIDFWTVERVRSAVPRDFVFDPATGRFLPTAPGGNGNGRPDGGGGGGGGGGGDSTTGASWDGGGTVADATGKVLFELAGGTYVCSATVIDDPDNDRSLVLTAAHCIYDHASGEFATNWMFIPNFDASPQGLSKDSVCGTLYGCWTASALVVHKGFASAGGFNGTAVQYDFGIAVLERGGEDMYGDPYFVDDDGSQAYSFASVKKGTLVAAFGYPVADPYFGKDLRYCAGDVNFDNRLFKLTYKLGCDMTGGASGGAWYSGFNFDTDSGVGTVMSVNSYRYSGGSALYGPKLNGNTQAVYDAALAVMPTSNVWKNVKAG